MVDELIPLYREKEDYTFFYQKDQDIIYKIQHKDRSFRNYMFVVIIFSAISRLLDDIYVGYQNILLSLIILLAAVGITYYAANKFYNNYYQMDTKHEVILNEQQKKEYATTGLKQLRLEIVFAGLALPLSILTFIIFLLTAQIYPLIIGSFLLGAFLILAFMKPLTRRKLLKQFKN